MNHSHIGRARLLSSRGGPYHLCIASYTRLDPVAQAFLSAVSPTFLSAAPHHVPTRSGPPPNGGLPITIVPNRLTLGRRGVLLSQRGEMAEWLKALVC